MRALEALTHDRTPKQLPDNTAPYNVKITQCWRSSSYRRYRADPDNPNVNRVIFQNAISQKTKVKYALRV
jgi:hypothetical protein